VSVDGRELGAAPGPFVLESGAVAKLSVTAKGYKPREITAAPTEDTSIQAVLEKLTPTGGGTAPKGTPLPKDLMDFNEK
jgi:hypothetical protein